MRRALVMFAAAVALAGCGGGTSVPRTPPVASALACLHRDGMTAAEVPPGEVRSLSSRSEHEPVPVTELNAVERRTPHLSMLVAYFATPAAATAATGGDFANVMSAHGGVEIQQAASGTHRGRVLLVLHDYRGPDLTTMLKAKHCTTGVREQPPS